MLLMSLALGAPFLTFESTCYAPITIDVGSATFDSGTDPDTGSDGQTFYNVTPVTVDGVTFDRLRISNDAFGNEDGIAVQAGFSSAIVSLVALAPADPLSSVDADQLPMDLSIGGFNASGECSVSPLTFDGYATEVYTVAPGRGSQAALALAYIDAAYGPSSDLPAQTTIDEDLQELATALTDGNCASTFDTIAGAYAARSGTATGDDTSSGSGGVTGTLDTSTKTFQITRADGEVITGVYNNGGRWFGQVGGVGLPDTAYAAGYWRRVRGARGAFYGATGTCIGPGEAHDALESWYGGF